MASIDNVLTSIDGTAGSTGDLNAGHKVAITLQMNAPVTVAGGVPTLSLNDHGVAVYDAVHSTATALVFDYTVATRLPKAAASCISARGWADQLIRRLLCQLMR